ncbi:MAG: hypothetical protein ACI3XQ_06105 [Eubacteriales bacterium]
MQQKNFTNQSKDVSEMQEDLENAERECMSARAECRSLREQLEELQTQYKSELTKRLEDERRHKAEMKQQAGCISVFALLICAVTCAIAAPWWTAVAPAIFAFYALRRAGL